MATFCNHWGGSDGDGYAWPDSNHGITVDYKGNVWIGGNGRGTTPNAPPAGRGGRGAAAPLSTEANETGSCRPGAGRGPAYYHDSMILKFTQDGKFLMAIGKAGREQRQQRYRESRAARENLRRSQDQ